MQGGIFSLRDLQDDVSRSFKPRRYLDPLLVLRRVTEALAVGIALARSLGWQPDTNLAFAFRWTQLRGRRLSPWVDPFSTLGGGVARDDEAETLVAFGLDTPAAAIAPYVNRATEDYSHFLMARAFLFRRLKMWYDWSSNEGINRSILSPPQTSISLTPDDWPTEETDDPLHADRRKFYKVEMIKWSPTSFAINC